jgi:phasin family protein
MTKSNNGYKKASSHSKKSNSSDQENKTPHTQDEIADMFQKSAEQIQENMQNFSPFTDLGANLYKKFQKSVAEPSRINAEKTFAANKKNMESLQDANRMALEVMRQITELQSRFMEQTFNDVTEMVQENMAFKNKTPQEYMANQGERIQMAVSRAMEHSSNISNIMLKSNQQLFKSVKSQFDEGMKEMHIHLSKMKH